MDMAEARLDAYQTNFNRALARTMAWCEKLFLALKPSELRSCTPAAEHTFLKPHNSENKESAEK